MDDIPGRVAPDRDAQALLPAERQQKLMALLRRDGKVAVTQLSERFNVTRETIRRDLDKLGRAGLLDRTHGGAIVRPADNRDLPYTTREAVNHEAKQRIAHKAATLIENGQSLFIDSSSTAFELLSALDDHRDLQLITNSLRLTAASADTPHALITVAGELRKSSLAFVDSLAEEAVARFAADWAVLGCKALHGTQGIMEANPGHAQIKRAMMSRARRIALLVDQSKFDQRALVQIADLDAIDYLVTEARPSPEWVERLEAADVRLIC